MEHCDTLPGLPEDMARECLLRVSVSSLGRLGGVCRLWHSLVNSREFFEDRQKAGTTFNCLCMIQSLPKSALQKESKDHEAPRFGVTVYDYQREEWSRLPPIPDFPTGLPIFCQMVGLDGKLYILGGWDPQSYEDLKNVYVFDFTRQQWKRCADMTRCRSFVACAAVDGKIFVAGGHDDNKDALNTAEVYCVGENRWESLPEMPESRDECGGIILDGRFLVVGGYETNSPGRFKSSADCYDPATGQWTSVHGMWIEGESPGPYVASQGQLYAVQGQKLLRYLGEAGSWTVVDRIPGDDRSATWISASGDGELMIMTVASSSGRSKALVHKRRAEFAGESPKWLPVGMDEPFSGLGRACCALEV